MSGGRAPLDLTLYLVTDTAMCAQRGVVATAVEAVQAGVSVVQLRDPDATDDDLVVLGRQLVAALRGSGVPVLVDDRVHLVEAIGAAGAHVGQGDLDVPSARRMLGPEAYLGLSVQTEQQLRAAEGHGVGAVDYLGVGPVWATATKADAATPGGPERLARIVSASPWPCVAIGGIGADRLPALRRTGVTGVAVVSAICGQPDIAAATGALRAAWAKAH